MPIKLTCTRCGTVHRFSAPYPVAGAEVHCGCGHWMVLSYPPDLLSRILAEGGTLAEPEPAADVRPYRAAPTAPRPREGADDRAPPSPRNPSPRPPEGHR